MRTLSATSCGASGVSLFLRVFLPFVAGFYVSYAFRSVNALLGPQIAAEFGLSAAHLGLLTGVYFLAFALFQVPAGILLDRHGPRRVNAALLLVAAAGAAVFAAAPSYPFLILGRALIGLGVSVCLMASFQAFTLWYPAERLATMNSRAFAVGVLGAMTATVPLELALRVASWRGIMFACAVAPVAVAASLFFVVPEREQRPARDSLWAAFAGVRRLAADPAFRAITAVVSTSQCASVSLITLWIATWLRDVAGYDREAVGLGLLVVSVAMIAGYLFFGRLADARARRGASTVTLAAGAVAVAVGCLALLALGVKTWPLALWSGFIFFSSAPTVLYSTLLRRFPKEMAGRVGTTVNMFTFGVMFLGQWGVGLVLSLWPQTSLGYAPAAYGWGLGMLAALQFAGLAWLWLARKLC